MKPSAWFLMFIPAVYSCRNGYVESSTREGYCIKVYSAKQTRNSAASRCVRDGAYLASVSNGFNNGEVAKMANGGQLWLGVNCPVSGRADLCTSDDKTNTTYSNFSPGFPVTDSQFGPCVYIVGSSGVWLSDNCDIDKKPFICEYLDNGLTCGNDGFHVNGTCDCDEYWTGKHCNIPICENGGRLDITERLCHCPAGFGGSNCQLDMCFDKIPYNFNINGRTMFVIIEATIQNQAALNQLSTNFSSIVNSAMGQHPEWFAYYGLVAYNSSGVIFSSFVYTDPAAVQSVIGIIASNLVDPGTCNTPIFGALNFALKQNALTNPDSHIFLVTASGPSDAAARNETVKYLAYSEAELHWLYQTSAACGEQPPGDGLADLVRLAYASNGNAVFITPITLSQFLFAYLPTRFMSSTLTNPTEHYNFTCAGASWVVEVDSFTTSVYITTSAMFGSVGLEDPNNMVLYADILYSHDQTKLYKIDTKMPGLYRIWLSSPGACYASVYSVGGIKIYNYFAGTTTNDTNAAHVDGYSRSPFAGTSNVAVFHFDDRSTAGYLQYVEIYDINQQKYVLQSELYLREGCTWEYYSDPFTCQNDLDVFVYGIDVNNQGFRRQMSACCLSGTLPNMSITTF